MSRRDQNIYILVVYTYIHRTIQYMGFGLSGSGTRTLMDGSDVTIAWIDNSLGPMAQDYHLRRNERTQVNIHTHARTQFWGDGEKCMKVCV